MKNEELLKPCAHCGSKKISSDLQAVNPYGTSSHCSNYVRCDNCGMGVNFTNGASGMPFQGARELWNTRSHPKENATASSQRASVELKHHDLDDKWLCLMRGDGKPLPNIQLSIKAVVDLYAKECGYSKTPAIGTGNGPDGDGKCQLCGENLPDTWSFSICPTNTCKPQRASVGFGEDEVEKFLVMAEDAYIHNNPCGYTRRQFLVKAICHHFNKPGLEPLKLEEVTKWLREEFGFYNDYIIPQLCAKFGTTVKEVPTVEAISKVIISSNMYLNLLHLTVGEAKKVEIMKNKLAQAIHKLLGGG